MWLTLIAKAMKDKDIGLLTRLGFELSAELKLAGDGESLDLSVFNHSREKGVYALVVDGEVEYVGETRLEFYRRIYSYRSPGPTQQTNIRVNQLLLDRLSSSSRKACEVWFLSDELIRQGKLRLQLGESSLEGEPDRSVVERVLIGQFEPPWNRA